MHESTFWFGRSALDREVLVWDIVLCFWTRHFSHIAAVSTQVYRWCTDEFSAGNSTQVGLEKRYSPAKLARAQTSPLRLKTISYLKIDLLRQNIRFYKYCWFSLSRNEKIKSKLLNKNSQELAILWEINDLSTLPSLRSAIFHTLVSRQNVLLKFIELSMETP